MAKQGIIAVPVQFEGVRTRNINNALRLAFDVPELFLEEGKELIGHEDKYFIILGPYKDEIELKKALKARAKA